MKWTLIICALLVPAVAFAGNDAPDLAKLIAADGDPSGAAFGFAGNGVYTGASAKDMGKDWPSGRTAKNIVGSYSKDKRAYWASAELTSGTSKTVDGHASALWEKTDKGWKLLAFSVVPVASSKDQQAANKKGLVPPPVKNMNGAKDEYFLTVFDGVWGHDAKDTVDDRKDSVMFGSGANERFTSGATIKKTLAGWNLQFEIRDGMATGITKGHVLWVAANMNARPEGKEKATPVPYRVFLIFQGDSDGGFTLVHASFAALTEQGWPAT